MKLRIIIYFIFFISTSLTLVADDLELDTIYYDFEWKGTVNPKLASYYRIIEKNNKEGYKKIFRDYYTTGELQGEGSYISIDRFDDSKSIFDGDVISYYKSGKVAHRGRYENGAKQGEYIRYFENGSVATRCNLLDGKYHGLYTEFNDSGLCFQIEYDYGKPIHDYLIVTSNNGLYSKVNIYDYSPIYTSPSTNEIKNEYRDGDIWQYYLNDGLAISMTNIRINDYGKYYRIYINLTNNSFYPIEFDPSETVAFVTNKKGIEIPLEIQTAKQYDKRIKRTQMWEEALVGIAGGISTAAAGYTTSYSTTSYNGFNGKYGTFYGNSYTTTTSYNANAFQQAQLAASQNLADVSNNNNQIRYSRQNGYLKKTTINPGESISGYFNIKRKKGDKLLVILNIEGAKYEFPWDVKPQK